MAGWPARLSHPVRGAAVAARVIVRALRARDVVQQPATVEGFEGGRRKAAHPERKPLQGRVRVLGLLQHQHREVREAQLAGEKQADGAAAGNHDIIES